MTVMRGSNACGAGGPHRLAGGRAAVFSAFVDLDSAVGVHLYGMGSDGAFRLRLVRPRCLHGGRRLRTRLAVDLLRSHPLDRHPPGHRTLDAARSRHRVSLLPSEGGRPLFRARDARAQPGRAAFTGGGARCNRRVARLYANVPSVIPGTRCNFQRKAIFTYFVVLWLVGLYVWKGIDRGIGREALDAISEDEDAAAAIGINVLREKLRVTVISAALTALGGAIYGQYMMYLNPETVSGIAVSLQIVFAASPAASIRCLAHRRLAADAVADRRPAGLVRHQFHRRR